MRRTEEPRATIREYLWKALVAADDAERIAWLKVAEDEFKNAQQDRHPTGDPDS